MRTTDKSAKPAIDPKAKAKIEELKDKELDGTSGGFTATDDLWLKSNPPGPQGAKFDGIDGERTDSKPKR